MELTNPTVIKQLLAKHGFHFSKAMGQNFLTEAWVPERIADEAGADRGAGVLEIGPGIGCLTSRLASRAGKVVAVELDRRLMAPLSESLADYDNIELVNADAMKLDLAELAERSFLGLRRVVCANLPYNITTPLLTRLLQPRAFERITVMVQREVAKRICAMPATPEYGAFTVFTRWYAEPAILFDVAPGCFTPRPKVTSSVVRLEVRTNPPAEVDDEDMFFRVVRAAFAQRRKTLVNAIGAAMGGQTRGELGEILSDMGLDIRIRGEALGVAEFAAVANAIGAMQSRGS